MKFLLSLILMTAFSSHALETDNYLAWSVNLPDSSGDINQLIQSQIEDVIISAEKDVSCKTITFRIANRFKTTPTRKLFEDWSTENLAQKMFPSNPYYLKQSIYRNTRRTYLSKSGLSPNLQVNGLYFGVDKLSHFGSTGRRYLTVFLKNLKQGLSAEEAEKSAIRFGLSNEAGILGLWPSGVFSYGDMEANFQGLRFYQKLCLNEQDSYLSKNDGRWELTKIPDIRNYVNPHWDESFNLSFRAKGMWEVSAREIKEKYCPLKNSEQVQTRFKLYQENAQKSFSQIYIEELQTNGYKHAPIPSENQSVDRLCEIQG
jgi:hypothetical protein